MSEFVFAPAPQARVDVVGDSARFPVRRIFCVGRNYAAHAREMGQDPDREPPFFFTKPACALVPAGAEIPYPPQTSDFQYEAELVVAIGAEAINCPQERARSVIFGFAIGNDLTRRDLQARAKEKGQPWDWGKGFDHSAVCGPIHRADTLSTMTSGAITLHVNGVLKQRGDLSELIWSVDEVISIISSSMALQPGDLIYTGTPAGVGPLVPGDRVDIAIAELGSITNHVRA